MPSDFIANFAETLIFEKHSATKPMLLLSFIIPYYNLPREMLAECVASVLRLPLQPGECEAIVVDDGSAVSLEAFLDERFPGRVRYVRQENGGLSSARNAGLALARGRYIQFVDGDDKLFSESYSRLLPALCKGQADVLLFRFSHKEKPCAVRKFAARTYATGADYMQRRNLRASACGYVFKKSLLSSLRFEPNLLHEDELFTPQLLLMAGTTAETGLCAYHYRVRTQSITTSEDVAHCRHRAESLFGVLTRLQTLRDALKGTERKALARRVAQLTMDAVYMLPQLVGSAAEYDGQIRRLRESRLFPLPLRPYTAKYALFALLTRCAVVRKMLYAVRRRKTNAEK